MLRQACGQGQKVDLAAQKGTLLGQQEACQELLGLPGGLPGLSGELLGCQEGCQEACQEALSSDLLRGGLGQQF